VDARRSIGQETGRSITADAMGGSMAGAPHSESELEQFVRNRLYGERARR
jgi:hypothetical protein